MDWTHENGTRGQKKGSHRRFETEPNNQLEVRATSKIPLGRRIPCLLGEPRAGLSPSVQ